MFSNRIFHVLSVQVFVMNDLFVHFLIMVRSYVNSALTDFDLERHSRRKLEHRRKGNYGCLALARQNLSTIIFAANKIKYQSPVSLRYYLILYLRVDAL